MIKENTEKRKTVRGSVLFTTVSVMALLIIFLSGALALASSANNRAHKSYSSSQASYNARAAIDSFMQAMQSDAGVAAAVHDMDANGLQPALGIADGNVSNPDVWDKDNNPSSRWGTIGYYDDGGTFHAGQIDIHKTTDQDQYEWDASADEGRGKWVNLTEYKITATARYGREEETVNAYMRTLLNITPSTGGGVKGIQAVGGSGFSNNGTITGGFGLNLAGESSDSYQYTDNLTIDTELAFLNASIRTLSTAKYQAKVMEDGTPSKMVVTGDFEYGHGSSFIYANYDMTPLKSDFTQQDVPYIFIEGKFTSGSSVGDLVVSNGAPFNFFAGSMNMYQGNLGSTDLYLMDSGADNYIGPYQGSPTLYRWARSMTATDTRFNSDGGNIYCNGNLTLNSAYINGDVRVAGDCNITGNTKIYGDLVVGGNLTTNGNIVKIVSGKVYAGSTADADAETLKDGYEVHENPKHVGELRPGYTSVTYPNVEIPVVEEVTQGSGDYGWHQVAFGDGSFTQEFEGRTVNCRVFSWSEASSPTTVYWLPDYSAVYLEKPYYRVDKNGYQTTDIVSGAESTYYTRESDSADVEVTEAVGDFFSQWDDPTIEATEQFYYYYLDPATGTLTKVEASEAYETGKINPITSYVNADQIYPTNMTKEKIYGAPGAPGTADEGRFVAADDSTKLIPNLYEQRKALGLDEATGQVTSTLVDVKVELDNSGLWDYTNKCPKAEKVKNLSDYSIYSGNVLEITESCTLQGNADNKIINIRPGADDIYILLDNVSFSNEAQIVVYNTETTDKTGKIFTPNVNFIINGKLESYNKLSIMNSALLGGGTPNVKYTDRYGIYFYGLNENPTYGWKSSSIKLTNDSTIVGVLRTPYTKFEAHVRGRYNIKYIGEDGKEVSMKPVIIGSAIVDSADTTNEFGIAYTIGNKATGGGGGGSAFFSATRDKYQVLYYSAS